MYLPTAHPHTVPRNAKPSDYSLDTSTESDDSGLLRQRTFGHNNIPYFGSKIKHSLCRNFTQQGFCSYGGRCQFAHGLEELRTNTFSNQTYKTRGCTAFTRDGYCFYGQRCNFIHELPHLQNEEKWRQIYKNFREVKDMFKKQGKKQGRLMEILKNEQK